MQPIISIEGIGKQFNAVRALDKVSFDVRPGELHAVMGENGAGKSTLMKILSGVITDYEGVLKLRGEAVTFSGTRDAEEAGISIIHQELNLVEQLSVSANIFLGREIYSKFTGALKQKEMDNATAELLSRLECSIHPRSLVGTLRVGDQQLIEIAKALSLKATILIMDEPTSALTETEVARLYRVIAGLREQGVTILYISHKMDEVFRLADRITVLRDGQFVTTINREETNPQQVAHLMVGRELDEMRRTPKEFKEQSVVLSVESLSLPWPGHSRGWRLQDISFQLCRGEILGIAGLMGAGRTELLECLFGASEVNSLGTIRIDGCPQFFQHPADAMAAGVALVTEDRKRLGLFSHWTVRDNISVCSLSDLAAWGVIARGNEHKTAEVEVQRLRIKCDGIESSINSLSGGNQQKCIIGRCLLTKPKILLLDDPTRGVDVGAKAELYRIMEQLAAEGMSIIVTSSELPELLTVSDRILVLAEGVLAGEFTREEANEEKIMEAATRVDTTASLN